MFPIRNDLLRALSTSLVAAGLAGATLAQQVIDLSTWQVVQYELNSQPDADWVLQPGNTSVVQGVNADASIFLSDFDAAGQTIQGTWRVQVNSDDDFMGFVFGYQGRGQYYLFDWKRGSQTFLGDFAEQGMSLKVVEMPTGSDPTQDDLWPTVGSANVRVLQHNTIPWAALVDYQFELTFLAGTIEITVSEAGQVLEQWMLADDTYASGQFGFYNYSQGTILYQGFTQESVPTVYCAAKTNSQGCTPTLTATGSASFSDPGAFDITADLLINRKNGLLFYGLSGRASIPVPGGQYCVAGPLFRLPVMNTGGSGAGSDCSGRLSVDFNALLRAGALPSVMVGDQVNAQFIYRDPQHPDGTGFGLTEGVEFVVLP